MKKCNVEGCNNKIWGKGFCIQHTAKKPLKKGVRGSTIHLQEKDDAKCQSLHSFLTEEWGKHLHQSEISGEKLYGFSSAYLHHILYKGKYPQAAFDSENIIILTMQEHANVHITPNRYPEINRRREYLMEKYGVG